MSIEVAREALRHDAPEPTSSEDVTIVLDEAAEVTPEMWDKLAAGSVQPDHERSQRNVERMIQAEERVLEQPDLPLKGRP